MPWHPSAKREGIKGGKQKGHEGGKGNKRIKGRQQEKQEQNRKRKQQREDICRLQEKYKTDVGKGKKEVHVINIEKSKMTTERKKSHTMHSFSFKLLLHRDLHPTPHAAAHIHGRERGRGEKGREKGTKGEKE